MAAEHGLLVLADMLGMSPVKETQLNWSADQCGKLWTKHSSPAQWRRAVLDSTHCCSLLLMEMDPA